MINVQKNWLEWLVFAVGLVLIVSLLTYLTYDAVTLGNDPPLIETRIGDVRTFNDSYLLPVTVQNLGDATAESVTVEVALMNGDTEIETAEMSIDFLPRKSTRSGWVTFETDPNSVDEIAPRILGYQVP